MTGLKQLQDLNLEVFMWLEEKKKMSVDKDVVQVFKLKEGVIITNLIPLSWQTSFMKSVQNFD